MSWQLLGQRDWPYQYLTSVSTCHTSPATCHDVLLNAGFTSRFTCHDDITGGKTGCDRAAAGISQFEYNADTYGIYSCPYCNNTGCKDSFDPDYNQAIRLAKVGIRIATVETVTIATSTALGAFLETLCPVRRRAGRGSHAAFKFIVLDCAAGIAAVAEYRAGFAVGSGTKLAPTSISFGYVKTRRRAAHAATYFAQFTYAPFVSVGLDALTWASGGQPRLPSAYDSTSPDDGDVAGEPWAVWGCYCS